MGAKRTSTRQRCMLRRYLDSSAHGQAYSMVVTSKL